VSLRGAVAARERARFRQKEAEAELAREFARTSSRGRTEPTPRPSASSPPTAATWRPSATCSPSNRYRIASEKSAPHAKWKRRLESLRKQIEVAREKAIARDKVGTNLFEQAKRAFAEATRSSPAPLADGRARLPPRPADVRGGRGRQMKLAPLVVLDVVGLNAAMLGPDAPHLTALAKQGLRRADRAGPAAVTCPVQSTYLTGAPPRDHESSETAGSTAISPRCSSGDSRTASSTASPSGRRGGGAIRRSRAPALLVVQHVLRRRLGRPPRPAYPADGRKIPDCYARPPELRTELNARLGKFPLFKFWGPLAGIESTRWIVEAALSVLASRSPTLTLVYSAPRYDLQRFAPTTRARARRCARSTPRPAG